MAARRWCSAHRESRFAVNEPFVAAVHHPLRIVPLPVAARVETAYMVCHYCIAAYNTDVATVAAHWRPHVAKLLLRHTDAALLHVEAFA